MQKTRGVAAAAVVACGIGAATAASASAAYSISGGAYSGAATNQTLKVGPSGPTWTCTTATFTGSATGAASTSFLAAFSGTGSGGSCNAGALGNSSIAVSGNWTMTVTGSVGPVYGVKIAIPGSSNVVIKYLTVPTCTITLTSAGNSDLMRLSAINTSSTGVRLYGTVSNIQYTASTGCSGISSGTRADMVYNTGGTASSGGINLPGMTVAGP